MDRLYLTGHAMGRVFNSRNGFMNTSALVLM
jgi:hypothetical protein